MAGWRYAVVDDAVRHDAQMSLLAGLDGDWAALIHWHQTAYDVRRATLTWLARRPTRWSRARARSRVAATLRRGPLDTEPTWQTVFDGFAL